MSKFNKKSIVANVGKWCIVLVITHVAFFSLLSPAWGNNQAVPTQHGLKTYVVYDDIHRMSDNYPAASLLVEYLGHFDLSITEMPIADWTPGSMADAELIVYVGLEQHDIPGNLLAEMAKAKQVIWFEHNIEQMAKHLRWWDFRLGLIARGWQNITLKDKQHKQERLFNDQLYVILTSPGQRAEEFVTISNSSITKPLAWKRDNIYYCGILNFETKFLYILANLLHQFIPNDHVHAHTAFLRIEDVNPLTPARSLKDIVDVIKRHRIPFAIGVVPVNVSASGSHTYLHKKSALVKVLQDAQSHGGSIIMHGYTHQNVYSPTTGEGYEFWNARDDKPMDDDENFTRERMQKGIAELVRSGLTPLAFEPPHYAMSKTAYKVLSEHFNIFSGQIQLSDRSDKITGTLPYIARSTYLNGMLVIPENLGYYDGKEFTHNGLLQNLVSVSRVQDGLAGFFYHGYIAAPPLDAIITSIKKQGYEFLDLRQFPIKVQSEQITITGVDGEIAVHIDEELKTSWRNEFLKPYVITFVLFIAFFTIVRFRHRAEIICDVLAKKNNEKEEAND